MCIQAGAGRKGPAGVVEQIIIMSMCVTVSKGEGRFDLMLVIVTIANKEPFRVV